MFSLRVIIGFYPKYLFLRANENIYINFFDTSYRCYKGSIKNLVTSPRTSSVFLPACSVDTEIFKCEATPLKMIHNYDP